MSSTRNVPFLKISGRTALRVTVVTALLIVLSPSLINGEHGLWSQRQELGWVLLIALAFTFWLLTGESIRKLPQWVSSLLLGFQFCVGFMFTIETLFLIAFELPLAVKKRSAYFWFALLILLFITIWLFWLPMGTQDPRQALSIANIKDQLIELFSILMFLLFAFCAGFLLNSEQTKNLELAAAQANIATVSRLKERQEVSRELHDRLGHNLTVLKLQLEILKRGSDVETLAKVQRADNVVKNLIREVRSVVDHMSNRTLKPFNIAVAELVGSIVKPAVTVRYQNPLPTLSNEIHLALIYCVQEGLTNVIKHASANQFEVIFSSNDRHIYLEMNDDGKGAVDLVFGNGLMGLKERVENLGGSLSCTTHLGGGYSIQISLPTPSELCSL